MTFLYVEDDHDSRDVMHMMLVLSMGHDDLTIFEDSTDFMQRLGTLPSKPDVIFLDIHMQPLNGFEMLQLLREHPDYHDATIIALTASVMNEEIERLKQAGFNGVIGKPLDPDEFPRLLAQVLAGNEVWFVS